MAYALVTAFVVFPTASRGSVTFLTFSGSPDISTIPPALSVIGPKASIATTIPVKESMDMAERAIPYSPAREYEARIAADIKSMGGRVDFMETASPAMILVPCPVVEALAIWATDG